jgi:hypothetical protein
LGGMVGSSTDVLPMDHPIKTVNAVISISKFRLLLDWIVNIK